MRSLLRRPSAWIVLALAIATAVVLLVRARGPIVRTVLSERRDLEQHIVASGRVRVPTRVQTSAQVSGLVVAVGAVAGQRVTKGDLLVQLDDSTERASVAQAEAAVKQAQARVDQLRRVGAIVATESLREAESNLEKAEVELERSAKLVGPGAVPAAELENARRAVDVARAQRNAAQACLLLLGLDHALYADVETLLVYPSTVVLPTRTPGVFERGGAVLEPGAPILGQAFRGGPVLLAWDQVLAGGREQRPGHNVVFHELAHKIDMLDGPVDGTPPLADARTRRTWAEVCSAAFLALRDAVERGERGALDAYAATNEAEFFAVATEAYFTRPAKLARDLPALHRVLVDFYRFTPPEA